MAAGFKGLLDFAGYSVGMATVAPAGGYKGLLDFSGFSVGASAGAPPTVTAKVILIMGDDGD